MTEVIILNVQIFIEVKICCQKSSVIFGFTTKLLNTKRLHTYVPIPICLCFEEQMYTLSETDFTIIMPAAAASLDYCVVCAIPKTLLSQICARVPWMLVSKNLGYIQLWMTEEQNSKICILIFTESFKIGDWNCMIWNLLQVD